MLLAGFDLVALGPELDRAVCEAALDGEVVPGYAILEESRPGVGDHAIAGVRRLYRGAPMRRVNERLGYRETFRDVHLRGPLP